MSCSLCRLPYTPSTISVAPRWPPPGVLSEKQVLYLKHAFGAGQYVVGLALEMVNMDNNNFAVNNAAIVVNIVWETNSKTLLTFHLHCATILRHQLGLPDDSPVNLIELSLLEQIVGPTMDGLHAGRLPDFNYEGVLGAADQSRVDIESLWSKEGDSRPDFDWLEWQRRGLDWTAVRPDVFPRFRPQVAPTRISSLGALPESAEDIITIQPLDVLHVLLPYLDNRSFVNLLSTCRTLRHQALTIFQPHSRKRVLELGWAVPTDVEYAEFVKRNPPPPVATSPTTPTSPTEHKAGEAESGEESTSIQPWTDELDFSLVAMPHPKHSPFDADWFLYLSQVHRTQAMRCRRWVWALAKELTRIYHDKRAAGPYGDVLEADGGRTKSRAWKRHAQTASQQLMIRGILLSSRKGEKNMSW
ncbi:hypothetical protein K466DRAFT_655877 [Polyporus arcularius HHB13444]|uniref:F-box domain-containing protein n=1 Tax=Polyporus arcularius HHB13444 TaxID=1314778 RepID=A0A5C3P183_9APHY|nr:hypothetical protein K466DRAFT_655877 [Polyporus arcularius HHB13444]